QPPNHPTIQPPTLTPTLIPTPTPKIKQLTSGGCCVNPFWSPDGSTVMFVDKPNETASAGIWGVKLNGESPQLITSQVGIFSPDFKYVAYPKATETVIAEVNGNKQWTVREAGGRSISFSPDSKSISWQVSSSLVNFDLRTVEVWVANVDGTRAKKIATLFGGSVSWWLPDSAKMLATVRKEANTDPILNILNIADGKLTPIAQAPGFRGTMPSPEGGWIIYQIAFSGDANKDGIWVVRSDGKDLKRLEVFGSYRWRSEGKILFVPLENITGKQSHRFIEVDAATGKIRAITDPNVTPFRIANGDWSLSPDSKRVVFLNAEDRNLWMLELP
ncbi:MAG: PD40 domain-containing protein, partial [Chloroflexi bacterium]|nr:PD40 domain-containing protein [Chloroflexota bacterium]